MTAKQLPSIRGLGSMEPPWCSRNTHACTTDVQRLYKGCTRVAQGINRLAIPEQCRSNTLASGLPHAIPSMQSGQCLYRRDVKAPTRSEERRVGKEGRSRWSPYH